MIDEPPLAVVVLDTKTGRMALDRAHDWYWWTQGNGGCDCNRELMFRPYSQREYCIGQKRYLVWSVNGEQPGAEFNEGYPKELIREHLSELEGSTL